MSLEFFFTTQAPSGLLFKNIFKNVDFSLKSSEASPKLHSKHKYFLHWQEKLDLLLFLQKKGANENISKSKR